MYVEIILNIICIALLLIIFITINKLKNDIKRTNSILNNVSKIIGIPEPFDDTKLKTLIAEGKKVEAIKRYRRITCTGIKRC